MKIVYIFVTVILLFATMYGCIGYGINLGRKGCKQTPLITVYCMLFGLIGTAMFITYLILK